MHLFSIIIPVFNRDFVIEKVLSAIESQTLNDWEAIIVDDGSTDSSAEKIKAYIKGKQNFKLYSQSNQGVLRARKLGIEKSSGKYIAFCDSDDVWKREYLQTASEILRDTSVECLFFDYQTEAHTTVLNEPKSKDIIKAYSLYNQTLSSGIRYNKLVSPTIEMFIDFQPVFPSAFILSRKVYDSIEGINLNLKTTSSEDAYLTMKASCFNNFYFCEKSFVTLGRNGDNLSSSYIDNLIGRYIVLRTLESEGAIPTGLTTKLAKEKARIVKEAIKQIYWAREYRKLHKLVAIIFKSKNYFR